MRIDVSFLPALAAAFLLVFARIGTMIMLMPGLGEVNIPTRIRLGIALALTLILLPLHRAAYQVDLENLGAVAGAAGARNSGRPDPRCDRAGDDLGADRWRVP